MDRTIVAGFGVPLSDTGLQWLGTLSALWSQVEYCVEAAIYNLQGLSFDQGRGTALPRDISKQAAKLAALAGDHCQGKERQAFLALCDRVTAAAALRNLAIHGNWARLADHDHAVAAVSWFKVPVGERINQLLADDLPDLTVEAGAISLEFYRLLDARGAFKYMAR